MLLLLLLLLLLLFMQLVCCLFSVLLLFIHVLLCKYKFFLNCGIVKLTEDCFANCIGANYTYYTWAWSGTFKVCLMYSSDLNIRWRTKYSWQEAGDILLLLNTPNHFAQWASYANYIIIGSWLWMDVAWLCISVLSGISTLDTLELRGHQLGQTAQNHNNTIKFVPTETRTVCFSPT